MFAQSISNVKALTELVIAEVEVGVVFRWLNNLPDTLKSLIDGFLPAAILSLALVLLYPILHAVSGLEGRRSRSVIEKSVLLKFFVFLIINVYLFSVVAGSFFNIIGNILLIATYNNFFCETLSL